MKYLTGRKKVSNCHDGFGELSFVYAYHTRLRFRHPSDMWILDLSRFCIGTVLEDRP